MRRLARILVLLVALALIAPASSSAAQPLEIAVQDDAVFVARQYYKLNDALANAQELRASWIRVNVLWASVVRPNATARSKPKKVKYDFAAYDQIVVAARGRGIGVQMALTTPAPAWATGNRKVGPYRPNPTLYADFVKATVKHFHSLVQRYSLLNEPNHIGWLAPLKSQAALYRSLYKAGYSAVKKTNSAAKVLIGETAPFARNKNTAQPPLKFLRDMLKGTKLRADGYAHHPYEYEHAPDYVYPGADNVTMGTLGRLTDELDRQAAAGRLRTPGGKPLDLYLTEFGYLRSGKFKLPDSTRGDYLKRAFDGALNNPRVRQMLHFLLVEPGKKYAFFDTSLVSRKGGKSSAYGALAQWAQGAASAGRIFGYAPPGSPPQQQQPPPSGGGGGGGGSTPPTGCGLPVCP